MQKKGWSMLLCGLLLGLTLPDMVGAQNSRLVVRPISFTDDAGPICEVKPDTFGPDVVLPKCREELSALCAELGCPRFDYVDQGTVSGDLNGSLNRCASRGPTVGDHFNPLTACLEIQTEDGKGWRGISTAKIHPIHGQLGEFFIHDGFGPIEDDNGSTIRATLTTLTINPLLNLNHGILVQRRQR